MKNVRIRTFFCQNCTNFAQKCTNSYIFKGGNVRISIRFFQNNVRNTFRFTRSTPPDERRRFSAESPTTNDASRHVSTHHDVTVLFFRSCALRDPSLNHITSFNTIFLPHLPAPCFIRKPHNSVPISRCFLEPISFPSSRLSSSRFTMLSQLRSQCLSPPNRSPPLGFVRISLLASVVSASLLITNRHVSPVRHVVTGSALSRCLTQCALT